MSEPGPVGHIVLCGLEGLSVRTIEELDRLGEHVVVVAHDARPRFREPVERLGVTIVDGDPQDPAVLRRAGIPGARAIVLTSLDDVGNIHAALAARSLDDGIHVAIRLFDEAFGEQVELLLTDAVALSASALAVPGFLSAITGEDESITIDLLGRRLVARHASPEESGLVVQIANDRASPVRLFPPPGPGLLSLVDAGPTPAGGPARPRASRLRRPHLPLVDRRLRWLGVVLVGLVVVSTLVFQVLGGVNVVDGIYNAVKAFFGGVDEGVLQTPELRLYAIILILLGAATLATFYALIADAVLSSRLRSILGTQLPDVRDHVIIVGLGTIGFRIAAALAGRGTPVLAAERQGDSRFIAAARRLGVGVLTSDARDPETLRTLRIDRAACLVASTDDDAVNLATALHARTMRPDLRIVVRLFDPDLAEHLDRALGDYEARSVSAVAAPAFAAAAIGRQVVATIPVGPRRIVIIARLAVAAGSPASGSTIGEEEDRASATEHGGCRVIATVDGSGVSWSPARDESIAGGSELVIVATRRSMAHAAARTLAEPQKTTA